MQRSTIIKILAVAGVSVAGYYCYKKLTQPEQPRLRQPLSVPPALGTTYFKQLAQQNAAKYMQAQQKLDQLAQDNMTLHQKLAKQFKEQMFSLPQQFVPMPIAIGKATITANNAAEKIEEFDNDNEIEEPYAGVGPGVRKLNIDEE